MIYKIIIYCLVGYAAYYAAVKVMLFFWDLFKEVMYVVLPYITLNAKERKARNKMINALKAIKVD